STLEEALLADLLVVVSDGASAEMARQHDVVLEVLASLGASEQPRIDVINKVDLMERVPEWPGAIPISARTGEGIEALLEEIKRRLRGIARPLRVLIPYAQGGLLAALHDGAQVVKEEYTESGVMVEAIADEQMAGRLSAKLGAQALAWLD
ncbi:MAG: GTPase HflX, partial [Clostridiales bacterium]|nr:GTPase HflX [Clostridiales bacterium]